MSSKPKSSRASTNSLLAAIQRKAPTNPSAEPEPPRTEPGIAGDPDPAPTPQRKAASRATGSVAPTKSRVGKPVQYWFHDEDRRLVRELAAWLAGQGERPTDSMVLRAVLRTAKTGGALLEAYRQAAQLDGRLKQHKTA